MGWINNATHGRFNYLQ